MKKLMSIVAVVAALVGGQALAVYTVDIGTPSSEAGYSLVGWGPIEPDTNPGNWGGIVGDPLSPDDKCRVIWDKSDDDPSASLTFPMPIVSVDIRHLLGLADDSFSANIYGGGELWGTINDSASSQEVWFVTTLSGAPGTTLTLTATGDKWAGFDTWGQVAIDWIEATPIPAPGAIVLGSIGVGLVGWLRRRRSL